IFQMVLMPSRIVICFILICFLTRGDARSRKPNIVIFLTDDQDVLLGSMDVMKHTRERFIKKGATFNNAFTTSPICCPSRSSFLTGCLYSHNHNVLTNNDNCSSIAWQVKHESRSFATYLNKTGYTTAYFGKYLNEYNGSYVPQGWDNWVGLIRNSRYYNYTLRVNSVKESHRNSYEKDYFTDLIVNRSMEYFQERKNVDPDTPILSILSFPAPHGSEDGAPQYQHLYANVTSHITPSFDYGPNLDKHWIISRIKVPMDETQHRFSATLQQKRLQTLRSVDDAVDRFVTMLEDTGELNNTYLLYTSDHGFHIGQFGLAKGKSMPYDFDIRVPLFMRGPGIEEGMSVNEIVLNIDMAPTILGIAGVDVPDWMDGRNFMPIVKRWKLLPVNPPWRDSFLVERGKIPHSKVHLARPTLPSKQERIIQACQSPIYKHPCDPGQEWTCVIEDGQTKKLQKTYNFGVIKQMSHQNTTDILFSRSQQRRRKCICTPTQKTVVSRDCMRRLNQMKRKLSRYTPTRERRRFIRRDAGLRQTNQWRSFLSGDEMGLGSSQYYDQPHYFPDSGAELVRSKRRSLNKQVDNQINSVCYSTVQMAFNSVFFLINTACMCRSSVSRTPKPRTSTQSQLSQHLFATHLLSYHVKQKLPNHCRIIATEIRQAYNKRIHEFRVRRERILNSRQVKKGKKRRVSAAGGRCNANGLSCFKLDHARWATPPLWEGESRCYCTNSNNNTYWCVRIINATSNLLYCEFITGFVEYYDLNTDPYQRSNTYLELDTHVHNSLNAELAQLRVCNGSANCH
uniref:Sulfatase N-terminal domain-containing protein n=1 Tax=Ciona savignyi TaxID=51511 RepID=H2YCP0_CIOSA